MGYIYKEKNRGKGKEELERGREESNIKEMKILFKDFDISFWTFI